MTWIKNSLSFLLIKRPILLNPDYCFSTRFIFLFGAKLHWRCFICWILSLNNLESYHTASEIRRLIFLKRKVYAVMLNFWPPDWLTSVGYLIELLNCNNSGWRIVIFRPVTCVFIQIHFVIPHSRFFSSVLRHVYFMINTTP